MKLKNSAVDKEQRFEQICKNNDLLLEIAPFLQLSDICDTILSNELEISRDEEICKKYFSRCPHEVLEKMISHINEIVLLGYSLKKIRDDLSFLTFGQIVDFQSDL